MNTQLSDFDRLVERYYPAVYHLAAQITSTPLAAMQLTNRIFKTAQSRSHDVIPQVLKGGARSFVSVS